MPDVRPTHEQHPPLPPTDMQSQVKRTVRVITQQHTTNETPEQEGYPMRAWNISIHLLTPSGELLPATCYEKVTYLLHETFGPKRMRQAFKEPPFTIHEKGWGEFDMSILLLPVGGNRNAEQTLQHDVNFQSGEEYESTHQVTFKNPKGALLEALRESGTVGDEGAVNGKGGAVGGTPGAGPKKVRKAQSKSVDMEKLAEALPMLGEEELLQVVQMVHDNKTEETYTKNDVENGEFHVDLYTLPDPLIKQLWDFTTSKVDMSQVA
ncbi:transcription factor TFIIF complex subunit Tfg3 [Oleoguttula sp. CCFEE 5521]